MFVKQIKPLVPVEADQQAVKMQVVIHGARPVPVADGEFVTLDGASDSCK